MKTCLSITASASCLFLAAGAAANGAVEEKCLESMEALGPNFPNTDPADGCACFVDEISGDDELVAIYLEIEMDTLEAWSEAPEAMQEAGDVCFPG